MIWQKVINYGKVLYSLEVNEKIIANTKELLSNVELVDVLDNPMIPFKEKEAVIEVVFNHFICNFIKVLCRNNCIRIVREIFDEYETILLTNKGIIKVKLYYVRKPDEKELDKIKSLIVQKYNKQGVYLELIEEPSLLGGIRLAIGDMEYDLSIKGRLVQLQKAIG